MKTCKNINYSNQFCSIWNRWLISVRTQRLGWLFVLLSNELSLWRDQFTLEEPVLYDDHVIWSVRWWFSVFSSRFRLIWRRNSSLIGRKNKWINEKISFIIFIVCISFSFVLWSFGFLWPSFASATSSWFGKKKNRPVDKVLFSNLNLLCFPGMFIVLVVSITKSSRQQAPTPTSVRILSI